MVHAGPRVRAHISSVTCLLLLFVVSAGLRIEAGSTSALYLVVNGLCLTLGSDQATVLLAQCGQYGYQQWDLSSGDKIQLGSYCLDAFPGAAGTLQIKPCSGSLAQSWWFGQDGKITNRAQTSGCLLAQGNGGFILSQCGPQSSIFLTSQILPQAAPALPSLPQQGPFANPQLPPMAPQSPQLPPMAPSSPQLPPIAPQAPQLPPLGPSQQTQQLPPIGLPTYSQPTVEAPASMSEQIQQQASAAQQQFEEPVSLKDDHYLCTCIVDASAEACTEAVRAACTVGHLDSRSCRESFSKGDHDKITDDILKMIQNGARCSKFDPAQLKNEAQTRPKELPTNAFRGSINGMPTAEDHYLCACLESNGSEKCKAAVKAACLVGHIPAGDCQASISRNNHDGVTDHVLRLIDAGAGCTQTLRKETLHSAQKPKSPGFVSRMMGRTDKRISSTDNKDLCACLDDPDSALCGAGIKRACLQKRIPKEDCDVAAGKHYMGGVTKHALKLIDHGAECPAHRSMTFTNHGCHCLQTWSEAGKIYSFPNNCVDAGGKRGFAWCKTFASEHCAGVEGSIEWDRCDNPKYPSKRDELEVNGDGNSVEGQLGEEDHYLCVCLAETSTDEVCVAAVKAACSVGHLPSEACRASFDGKDHSAVSDVVVKLLQGGARCQETMGDAYNTYTPKPGETKCPNGFYGFPACRRKKECITPCGHGEQCDYADGTCQCLPNFTGRGCSQCAEGYSGRHCTPDGQGGGGWTLGQGLVYLFLFAGLMYAGFTFYKRFISGDTSLGVTYQRLSGAAASAAAAYKKTDLDEDDPEEGIAMESDLGGDSSASSVQRKESPKPPAEKPKHLHTGLAV